mgnify:CR=1 FL=1
MLLTIASCLTIPIFGLAIVEFRPDMWCAGLTVLGTLIIVLRDPRETRNSVIAGAIFAAALLMKPTFGPLIVVLFGAAFVLRVGPEIRSAKDLKSSAKSVLILGGITLLLAAPYFILGRQHLIDYYRLNVFGSAAALWTPNLSAINSALYYILGPGGNATLGKWVYIGIPAVAFISLRSWRIGVLILISYLVVTLPGNKSPYLGMIFNAYVVAAIVLMMYWLLTITNPAIGYAIAGVFLVFGLATYHLPWGPPGSSLGVAEARQKLNADVVSVLLSDSAIEQKIIYIPVIASYLNGDSIVFSALQAGHRCRSGGGWKMKAA